MVFVGIDLHSKFSTMAAMTKEGLILNVEDINNEEDKIVKYFSKFKEPISVAIEATSNWYWMYDLLEKLGVNVKLAHPLKTKAIASAKIKTDRIDAEILSHLLRTDLLPTSFIAPKEVRKTKEVLRYRLSCKDANSDKE